MLGKEKCASEEIMMLGPRRNKRQGKLNAVKNDHEESAVRKTHLVSLKEAGLFRYACTRMQAVAFMKENMDLRKDIEIEGMVRRFVDDNKLFDADQHSRPFPGSAVNDRKRKFGMSVEQGRGYGSPATHLSMGSPVALGRIQIMEGHTLAAEAAIDSGCAVAGKKAMGINVLVKGES